MTESRNRKCDLLTPKNWNDTELDMLERGYVTPRMVATRVGRHPATVIRLTLNGKIASKLIGQQKFMLIADVEAYYEKTEPDFCAMQGIDWWDWRDIVEGAPAPPPKPAELSDDFDN